MEGGEFGGEDREHSCVGLINCSNFAAKVSHAIALNQMLGNGLSAA
jgi:hypothetical protein